MQETVCGVRFEGEWEELANKGKAVTKALEEAAPDRDDIEEWEQWRPRASESMDEDHREKTVEHNTMGEDQVKPHDTDPTEDAGEAVEEVSGAVAEMSKGRVRRASGRLAASIHRAGRSIHTATKAGFQRFEAAVYHHIMTRTNPHYFDSDLVSASVSAKGAPFGEKDTYELTVNINDQERVDKFRDTIRALN